MKKALPSIQIPGVRLSKIKENTYQLTVSEKDSTEGRIHLKACYPSDVCVGLDPGDNHYDHLRSDSANTANNSNCDRLAFGVIYFQSKICGNVLL